ncbi:MAG TPA: glycoside hydrolase family 25 protein, partial [Chitinophagaceae bacterium]
MARRKKNKSKVVLWVIMLLMATAGFFGYKWWLFHQAETISYQAFGISIPGNYLIHGIDVSKYQQIIAWEEVKEMQVEDIK